MKRKNKKGFTLIELLAVIVILAIIALIATPLVLKYIEKARQESAEASVLSYVEAIETEVAASQLKNNVYPDKENYNYDEIKVSLKGTTPTSGSYSLKNGMVKSGTFCINGYEVNYINNGTEVVGTCDSKNENDSKETLNSKVNLGDYISMTPELTSFTTDKTYTGYSSTQTINPSELNLWRVIRINGDGTMDMVSEYVSNTEVFFGDKIGYKNLVGYLNVLASKYENSNYTVSSRHMGYNGQTEYLIDTANTLDSTSATSPWTSNTGSSTVESQGGGDTLYITDTNLVTNTLGTLVAKKVGSTKSSKYWLASRYYNYYDSTMWFYIGRAVDSSGNIYSYDYLYSYYNRIDPSSHGYNLRPIVTLKSNITTFSGSGTNTEPWVLS